MTEHWPAAELVPVRRLRVLAASLRFPVCLGEITVPVPLDVVWAVAADLERELPRSLPTVRSAPSPGKTGTGLSCWRWARSASGRGSTWCCGPAGA